jgi:hypothetical protein
MKNNEMEEIDHTYSIDLPIEEAAEVSDKLEETVWAIAKEQGVEQTLRDANFDIQAGKPFFDPHTLITVIVHFAGGAAAGAGSAFGKKVTEKAWEAWTTKVLPRLKEKFGPTVLVDKDKQKESK